MNQQQQIVPYNKQNALTASGKNKNKKKKKNVPALKQRRLPRPQKTLVLAGVPNSSNNQLAAAYSVGQTTVKPRIRSDGTSCRIVHRELILKVAMTVNFAVTTLNINPGLPGTFPWLSQMASNWETYRFNRLRFCYFTRVGSATGGSVILAPDYDAADLAPVSEQIASSYIDTAEDVSWKDICCTLRPEGMHALGPKKFIRAAGLSANLDIKTYDAGLLNVATVDGVAGPAGNLWAEYDITLSNPQLNSKGNGAPYQRYLSAAGATTANIMGGFTDSSTATFATFSSPNTFTFIQAGRYEMDFFVSAGTSTTEAGVSNVVGGGGTRVDYSVSGNGTGKFDDDMVIDAVVGTTVQYPLTIVGVAASDILIIPLMVNNPY